MAKKLFNTILIVFAIVLSVWFGTSYSRTDSIFYGDAEGYYMYLPAAFIYNNLLSIDKLPDNKEIPSSVTWYVSGMGGARTPKGYVLNQYTYGIALMEAPFFFAAHAYEKLKGTIANGYSATYERAIKLSSIIYTLLGLIVTYLILRRFFTTGQSLLTIVLIYTGSNLFWFTIYQGGMAHIPLFFLYALLVWLSMKLHEKPSLKYFLIIAFVSGIITLIRPTDIICLLIPLLYNVYSRETLKNRIEFLKQNIGKISISAIIFLLPIIPQLIYWKILSGSYLYYSYGSQGFNWLKPRMIDGLFSYSNGWIAYSPIMLCSLVGLFFYKKMKPWAWCLWLLFPLYCYIIYSWYCFNYINGLGSRPMIHLYSLLAIPFCAFIAYVAGKHLWVKTIVLVISIFFISLNVSYSIQKIKGVLITDESNIVFNYQMLYRMDLRYSDMVTMDIAEAQPDEKKLNKIATLKCEDYEKATNDKYVKDTTGKSHFVYDMGEDEHHPNTITLPYSKKLFKDAKWFKASGRFMITDYPWSYKHLFVLSVKHKDKYLIWQGLKLSHKIGLADSSCGHIPNFNHIELNRWGYVYYYSRIPGNIKEGDMVELDLWNIGKQKIFMDDICLELYK